MGADEGQKNPRHPRNPRLQIPGQSKPFRKWDGEIPTTGQEDLEPIGLASRKAFSF